MKGALQLILGLSFLFPSLGLLTAADCSFEILSENTANRTYKFDLGQIGNVPLPQAVWTVNGEEKAKADRLYYVFLTAGNYEICANIPQAFQCSDSIEHCINLVFEENWESIADEDQNLNFFYHSGNYFSFDGDPNEVSLVWTFYSLPEDSIYEGSLYENSQWSECDFQSVNLAITYYSSSLDEFTTQDYEFESFADCPLSTIEFDISPLLIRIFATGANDSGSVFDSLGNQLDYAIGSQFFNRVLCEGSYEICTVSDLDPDVYNECVTVEIPNFRILVQIQPWNENEWIARINENVIYDSYYPDLDWSLNGNNLYNPGEWAFQHTSVVFGGVNSDESLLLCLDYNIDPCGGEACTEVQLLCQPEVYLNTIDDVHYFTHSQEWEGNYYWEINGLFAGDDEVLELPVDSVEGSTEVCVFYEADGDENYYKCTSHGCFIFDSCDLFSIDAVDISYLSYISFNSPTSQTSLSYAINGVELDSIEMTTGSYYHHVGPGFYDVCAVFLDSVSVSPPCEVEICEDLIVFGNCGADSYINFTMDGSLVNFIAYPNATTPPWGGSYNDFRFQWYIDGELQSQPIWENTLEYDFDEPYGNKQICVMLENWDCLQLSCTTITFPCPFDCGEAQLIQNLEGNDLHLEVDFSELVCPYNEEAEWWINEEYWGSGSELNYIFSSGDAIDIEVQYITEFNCEKNLYTSIIYSEDENCHRAIGYEYCGSLLDVWVEGEFDDTYEINWALDGNEWEETGWNVSNFISDGDLELCLEIRSSTCYFEECVMIEESGQGLCDLVIEIDQSELLHVFSITSPGDPGGELSVDWELNGEPIGNGNSVEFEMEESGDYRICAIAPIDMAECLEACLCEYFELSLGCEFDLVHEPFWGVSIFEIDGTSSNNIDWFVNGLEIQSGPGFEFYYEEAGEYEICAERYCSPYLQCETLIIEEVLDCDFSISSHQQGDLLIHFTANSFYYPIEPGFSEWTINGEPEGYGFQFTHEFDEFGTYEICFNFEGMSNCNYQQCADYVIEEFIEPEDCYLHLSVEVVDEVVEFSYLSSGNLIEVNWTLNGAPFQLNELSYNEGQPGFYQMCLQAKDAAECLAESCVTYQVFDGSSDCIIDIVFEGEELDYEFWAVTPNSLGEVELSWFSGNQEIGTADTIQYSFPSISNQIICVEYLNEDPLCGSTLHCEDILIAGSCDASIEYELSENTVELTVVSTVTAAILQAVWSVNGAEIEVGETISYTLPEEGDYNFAVEIDGTNGCHSFAFLDLEYIICDFEIAWEADGNQHFFEFSLANPITLTNIEWSLNGNVTSNDSDLVLSLGQPGIYEMCLSIESSENCQHSKCVEFEVIDQGGDCATNPSVVVEENGTVHLSANYLPTNDLEVYWDYGSGEILNGDMHVLTGLGPGNYSFCFYYFSPDCNNSNCVDVSIDDPLCLFEIIFENDLLESFLVAEGYAGDNFQIEWTIDDVILEGSIIEYVFSDFGQWVVCATASDGEGGECQHCEFVLVEDPSGDNCAIYFDALIDENTLFVGAQPLGVLAEDLQYSWSFGDGSTAVGQNATHIYSEPGVYDVCVELETELPNCNDISCMSVVVESLVFDLTGIVTTGDLQDDELIEAIVYLYQYDEEFANYELIDTSHTQSTQFQFSELDIEAEYIVRAVLKSSSALIQNHTPTYFDQALYWELAQRVDFNSGELVLQLRNIQLEPGDGFIEGQLINQLESEAIEGALIVLTDTDGNAIGYTYTDEFGYFSFDNLSEGSYFVFADVVNTESDFVLVKIKPENLSNHYVDLIYTGLRIEGTTASSLDEIELSTVDIFPNPFGDYLTIEWSEKSNKRELVELFDFSGRRVHQQKIDQSLNSIRLESAEWNSGIYLVRFSAEGEGYYWQKVVKH